jgi:hypothetical protein
VIVRILGEEQYEVDDEHLETIEAIDARLAGAIEADDEETFAAVLQEAIETVRSLGTPVDAETIVPSKLTIPHEGATISEVRALLAEETAGADKGDGAAAGIVAEDTGES